jgi:hypothetical protein
MLNPEHGNEPLSIVLDKLYQKKVVINQRVASGEVPVRVKMFHRRLEYGCDKIYELHPNCDEYTADQRWLLAGMNDLRKYGVVKGIRGYIQPPSVIL